MRSPGNQSADSRAAACVARRFAALTALAAALVLAPAAARAGQSDGQTKLYLTTGSYVLVKTYQVQGDRVRFYNLDTSEWEEMPVSLVDFEATKRARQEESAAHAQQIADAKKLEAQHFDVPEAVTTGFAVAPGKFLPAAEGVYAYDGLRVITLIQSQGEVVTDKQRLALNLAIPLPLLKKRALVSLPGAEAAVRIVNPQPVFYIEASDGWGAKAEIIPVKSGRDTRVVEKVQSGLGAGASGEVRDSIPVERTPVGKGVCKLQPSQPLVPGEYAIGEMVDGKLNLEVWDFGIDKPGRKTALETAGETPPAPMTEQRPGENRKQAGPGDVMPPHRNGGAPMPSGQPLPDSGVGPPVAPPPGPVQPAPPSSGPPPV